MTRISTNMPNDDMQYHLRAREWRMNELQNKMASQSKVHELRDDPVAAAHSTRYKSHIARLDRYVRNIETLSSDYRITEEYVRSANTILHRVRELAVQGANGSYSAADKKMMAVEINQYVNELVQIANGRSAEGMALFGGDDIYGEPFQPLEGRVPGADGQLVTQVLYSGGQARSRSDVSEGASAQASVNGSEIFWAERQEVIADRDASAFVVEEDTAILLDDVRIELRTGDNVYAVMAKINDSVAAVKASLDPVTNALTLRTTYPHQLWAEDAVGGTVLQDLGILAETGKPPYNFAPAATVSGGSMFDMVISLRDKLFAGETFDVGGSALKGIDLAQSHMLSQLADLGSRYERLDLTADRLSAEIPEMQRRDSEAVDLDMSEAILNLRLLEYTHKAALQTAGRILQPTLLDFLR